MEQNCARTHPRSVLLGLPWKSSESDAFYNMLSRAFISCFIFAIKTTKFGFLGPWWLLGFTFWWKTYNPHLHIGLFASYSSQSSSSAYKCLHPGRPSCCYWFFAGAFLFLNVVMYSFIVYGLVVVLIGSNVSGDAYYVVGVGSSA